MDNDNPNTEQIAHQPKSPSFASTPTEIRMAVEQNAADRGVLLIQVLASLHIDVMLAHIDKIAQVYDCEEFCESSHEIGISLEALKLLNQAEPPIRYPYYFCLPQTLIQVPELIFYYRNMAMLSRKVMRAIGLDTQQYEERGVVPSEETADVLSTYFNRIISKLVLAGGVTPYRHIVMMTANLGDSLGGTSRNEVGRVAMMRLINPLVRHLFTQERLSSILYTLKGQITGENTGAVKRKRLMITSETDVKELLNGFETYRVLYHELETSNGSKLLLNRQLTWQSQTNRSYKVGPDLYSNVADVDMLWAAELKGGADPAGSDEHWKTATQALGRILQAAEKTDRSKPMLSFIATILVERVAREAQSWIEQGKLTSVYNLTQMYNREEEMGRFLNDMTKFLGYDETNQK